MHCAIHGRLSTKQQNQEAIQCAFSGNLYEEMNGSFVAITTKKLMYVFAVCWNANGIFLYNKMNKTGALLTENLLKFLVMPLCKREVK